MWFKTNNEFRCSSAIVSIFFSLCSDMFESLARSMVAESNDDAYLQLLPFIRNPIFSRTPFYIPTPRSWTPVGRRNPYQDPDGKPKVLMDWQLQLAGEGCDNQHEAASFIGVITLIHVVGGEG